MSYSEELMVQLQHDATALNSELSLLFIRLGGHVALQFTAPRAKEYLLQGVCRRVETIRRCMVRIFNTFAVDRRNVLDDDERSNVEVSLQAFLLNLYGVFDNVAWTLLFEKHVSLPRNKVGLFLQATQQHLAAPLLKSVTDPKIQSWYKTHVKPYRDALAHRIPVYVPPMGLDEKAQQRNRELEEQIVSAIERRDLNAVERLQNEQEGLGVALPVFSHSYSKEEGSPPMWLHPQVIVDGKTMLEVLNTAFPTT